MPSNINGVPMINGTLYSWADVVVVIGGVPVTGITAIEYDDKQDIANVYGAGRFPIGRAKGRITTSAKINLLQEEVEAIQRNAPNGRLQDIAPFEIIVSYLPDNGIIVTDKIRNVSFTENARKWKEGQTASEVELPLLPSHIEWGAKK